MKTIKVTFDDSIPDDVAMDIAGAVVNQGKVSEGRYGKQYCQAMILAKKFACYAYRTKTMDVLRITMLNEHGVKCNE